MSDVNLSGIGSSGRLPELTKPGGKEAGSGFDKIVDEAMGKLSQVQADAQKSVDALESGGDVTEAMLAMQQADMNFQLMVEVRNKLLSAYQEIMRMQV